VAVLRDSATADEVPQQKLASFLRKARAAPDWHG
jgi:hypothetical protein